MLDKKRRDGSELYKDKKDLVSRINLIEKYGTNDFNQWLLKKLKLQQGEKVLDIGCGNGSQILAYSQVTNNIVGIDLSESLLREAKKRIKEFAPGKDFVLIRENGENIPFKENTFDVVTCNFAIYYMNEKKVMTEIKRVLKPYGRFLIASPPDDTSREMVEMHYRVAKYIPPQYQPGSSDLRKEVLPVAKKIFCNLSLELFVNPIVFPDVETFMEHYMSSTLYVQSKEWCENLLFRMKKEAQRVFAERGNITVTKKVEALKGYKRGLV